MAIDLNGSLAGVHNTVTYTEGAASVSIAPAARVGLGSTSANSDRWVEMKLTMQNLAPIRVALANTTGALATYHVNSPVQITLQDINLPVTVVRQLYARTPGQAVSPGAPLLDLVPESQQLVVEAQIAPGDVGFLHPGQKTRIKVSAYDFAVYGALDGQIQRISADTVVDKDSRDPRPHYLVTIAAPNALLDRTGQPLALAPGMTASVDIVTGRRTVLTYLFKPLVRGMSQALRER
jgi:HlyD family type I secretion membrane fusion protein